MSNQQNKKCCDTCKHYHWYYDKCDKYDCEMDARSVCAEYEPYQKGGTNRKNCEYRHENGNCLKVGGFCMSVDDKHCVKGGKK